MKRSILIIAVILSATIASCTVFLPQLRLSGVMLIGESERKTNLVTISVQPGREYSGKSNGNWNGNENSWITGFYVEFRNPNNYPVYIVWEKSSVKYDGKAFSPFVQGQRYEDFSRPMNSMMVPPNSSVRKYIYSSQQPYREAGKSGNWKMRPIESDHILLVFCVQYRDTVDYYTIDVR